MFLLFLLFLRRLRLLLFHDLFFICRICLFWLISFGIVGLDLLGFRHFDFFDIDGSLSFAQCGSSLCLCRNSVLLRAGTLRLALDGGQAARPLLLELVEDGLLLLVDVPHKHLLVLLLI